MKTSEILKNPEISLIFVNFRSARLLRGALCALFRDKSVRDGAVEIIIANNDRSETWALRAISRNIPIRIITFSKNVGFGKAANEAARYANAACFGFINPDTEFLSGNIGDIPMIFRKRQDIGILGARLLSDDGNPETWSMGKDITLWQIFRNNLGVSAGKRMWESDKPKSVGFVSGAALFIRKSTFDFLCGFDERFFLYFEDADLCFRARRAGYRVFSFPKIVFRHIRGGSHFSTQSMKQVFYTSQEQYFSKNRPVWEGVFLSIVRRMFL